MSGRKGPRLDLRPARGNRKAYWVILDTLSGRHEESTGCGADDRAGAERQLQSYLARKHVTASVVNSRDPNVIPVADVLALYARDVAPGHARPKETAQRISALLMGFSDKLLGEVNGEACREHAKTCASDSAARRQLEELRAAINHHRSEGHCSQLVGVWLPPKRQPRERWLSRSEAAAFIRSAWKYREVQNYRATDRRSRQHVAKFALVGLYTGTRAGRICTASFYPAPGCGYVDVDAGVFYRRPPGARASKKVATPVPLPPRLLAHLRRWKRMGQRFVVEWERRPVKRVSKAFAAVVRALKLKDVMPHTLRHTAATWLMQAGTEPWVASGFLGMSVQTLLDNYGHHHPDFLAGARDAFARMRR
jgi:integrase